MLTKYKFLLSTTLKNFSRNSKQNSLNTLRCAKFSSQPDANTTVQLRLII